MGSSSAKTYTISNSNFVTRSIPAKFSVSNIVGRFVIQLVQAGVQHHDRNLRFEERMMIAVGLHHPGVVQLQRVVDVAVRDQPSPADRGARAVDLDLFVAQPTDHIEIDACLELSERDGRIFEPVFRAEQVDFFAVPKRDDERAFRRDRQRADRLDQFQHRGRAAGVVVGAVMDVTDRTVAVFSRAVADVIVVRTDQDVFVAQLRVRAFDYADDVPQRAVERLIVPLAGQGGGDVHFA
ncbi:MAG: hypothetical protein QM811_20375 [Pirellulales bacterium]